MEIPITITLLRNHQGVLFYSNRDKMYSSMVFLFSFVTFLLVSSVNGFNGFTYDDFLALNGYNFCSHEGPGYFQKLCVNAAVNLHLKSPPGEIASDMSCKCEKSMTFVDPTDLGSTTAVTWPWVLRCTFKDHGHLVAQKYFGQGKNQNDVFMYYLQQDDTLAPERNLENVLVGA